MYFRLYRGIPDLNILGTALVFERLGPQDNISTTFRRISAEEPADASHFFLTVCEAVAEVTPPRKAVPIIEALWERRVPPGFDLNNLPEAVRASYAEGDQIDYEIPLSHLPNTVQILINQTFDDLIRAIERVLGIICWRLAQAAPVYSYRYGRMQWSFDGSYWKMSPVNFVVDTAPPSGIYGGVRHEIVEVLNAGHAEPLARELFRESWSQKNINSRSALVLGVTALETGVKDLIVHLIPQTEWLVGNLPSPPVYRILKEYFPTLSINNRPGGKFLRPSDDVIKEIRIWIDRRNQLVHGKGPSIEPEQLTDFLLIVSDFLYACDYCRGLEWALDLIRPQTRDKLLSSTSA